MLMKSKFIFIIFTIVFIFLIINCNNQKLNDGSKERPYSIIAYWNGLKINKSVKGLEYELLDNTSYNIKIKNLDLMDEFKKEVNTTNPDMILVSPLDFLFVENKNDYREIAVAIHGGSPFRQGQCIIRKDIAEKNNIKKLDDTKGLKSLFVNRESQTGYLLGLLKIKELNTNPFEFYKEMKFVYKHQEVVREVLRAKDIKNDFVIGWNYAKVHESISYYIDNTKELMVLCETEKIPHEILYIRKDIEKEKLTKIARGFMEKFASSPFKDELKALWQIESFKNVPVYDKNIILNLFRLRESEQKLNK